MSLLLSLKTWSAPIPYKPSLDSGSSIQYTLPYSMGIHEGKIKTITGIVSLDLEHSIGSGELHVPIEALETGKEEQNCHLREAMGLNYQSSDFPKEHVCDKNHQLPSSGKNAIAYPEIIFKISSIKTTSDTALTVNGVWTMHGVSHPAQIEMKLRHQGDQLRLQGEIHISLKDYGIEVKSARVLFVTISVHDQATVKLDLIFIKS